MHLEERKEHHMELLEQTVIEQAEVISDQRKAIAENTKPTEQHQSIDLSQLFTPLMVLFEHLKIMLTSEEQLFDKIIQYIEPTYVSQHTRTKPSHHSIGKRKKRTRRASIRGTSSIW